MDSLLLASIIYKTIGILVGFGIVILGYKLFIKGITRSSGNVSASFGDVQFNLKNAAPGIVLMVFGGSTILLSIFRGIDLKTNKKSHIDQSQIANTLTITDTTLISILSSKKINIDSLYHLGQLNLKNKKYLDAYKYFLITKGAILNDSAIRFNLLDSNIKLTTRALTQFIYKIPNNENDEETKSVNINDENSDH